MLCCHPIDHFDLLKVLFAGLLAHISVNMLNEFLDFRSGLDLSTLKTPFSGGSGALPENPSASRAVAVVALGALGGSVIIGLHLATKQDFGLIPIGLTGVLIIVSYTQWLNRRPLLCLIAPGVAFGPLMVAGTHVALTGKFDFLPFYISMVPFFLTCNLLLLNQLPDIRADESVGRNHFAIAYGIRKAVYVYGAFTVCAYCLVAFGIFNGILPVVCAMAFIPMICSVISFVGIAKSQDSNRTQLPFLGINATSAVLTPVFLGIPLLYASI